MIDPGDEHQERDILERLDIYWPGMGEMANLERREAARQIRVLRDEVRKLRNVLPAHIERILSARSG